MVRECVQRRQTCAVVVHGVGHADWDGIGVATGLVRRTVSADRDTKIKRGLG